MEAFVRVEGGVWEEHNVHSWDLSSRTPIASLREREGSTVVKRPACGAKFKVSIPLYTKALWRELEFPLLVHAGMEADWRIGGLWITDRI